MTEPVFSLPNPPSAASRKRREPEEGENIKALVEEAVQAPVLTSETLASYETSLIEAILENERQRERHPDEPERFFESEVTLYELLHRLEALAVDNQLMKSILQSEPVGGRVMASILSLLATHPNDDIAEAIVKGLLDVVTGEDEGSLEFTQPFVALLGRMGVYGALLEAATLQGRQQQRQQQQTGELYALILELLQGLLAYETTPSKSEALEKGWPLLLTTSVLDEILEADTRITCAEVLLGLASLSPTVREQLAMGGLARLLGLLASAEPPTKAAMQSVSADLLPLVGDIICTCLLEEKCLEAFLDSDGLATCVSLITCSNPIPYAPALRVISFALLAGPLACERFIREEGLKYLFPLFMGRHHHAKLAGTHASKVKNHREGSLDPIKDLEIICTMLQCLLRYVQVDGAEWRRLVGKFQERQMEKMDRLIALLMEGGGTLDNKQIQVACSLIALDLLQLAGEDGLAFRNRVSPELQDRIRVQAAAYIEALDPDDPYRRRLGGESSKDLVQ